MCIHMAVGGRRLGISMPLFFTAVNHVDRIAYEHCQDDDDKADQGIVIHGVLLFSER